MLIIMVKRLNCLSMKFTVGTMVLLLMRLSAGAQMPGPTASSGIMAGLGQMFGSISAFTAKTEVQVLDDSQQERIDTPMEFAFLDGKMRVEMDLSQARNRNMPAGMANSLKQMGLARVVSVFRPDKKTVYFIYPDQKILLSGPLESGVKITTTPLGKEVLEGHPCVKNQLTMTDEKGHTTKAIVWNAKDLKDFPIQIQTTENGNNSFVRFSQIKFIQPDSSQFDPPGNVAQYSDQEQFKRAILTKIGADSGQK